MRAPGPGLIDFRNPVDWEAAGPDPARCLAGQPEARVANRYQDPDGRFFAGDWASSPGTWRVEYTEHEFCHLLEGVVVLTADDGRSWRFVAGDAWVIPAGFRGTWQTVESARKRYAILEPA